MEEWCQNLKQEVRSSGKMMEVCRSSYRQNLFLDPKAAHFSNLETSATRLARIYLYRLRLPTVKNTYIYIRICIHIYTYVYIYIYIIYIDIHMYVYIIYLYIWYTLVYTPIGINKYTPSTLPNQVVNQHSYPNQLKQSHDLI